MDKLTQLAYLISSYAIVFAISMLVAFVRSRTSQDEQVRKRIISRTANIFGLVFVGYFGFIALIMFVGPY